MYSGAAYDVVEAVGFAENTSQDLSDMNSSTVLAGHKQ